MFWDVCTWLYFYLSPLGKYSMVDRCAECPFHGTTLVGSKGPCDSPLVIVGESPGAQELKTGLPFMGSSGKLLDEAIKMAGITEEPYFLNAMQCFPGNSSVKNQDRVIQGTRACQQRLRQQILEHPRKAILALGNPAVWATTNDFGHKITQIRGKRYDSDLSEAGIVAAVHPAFLLRGGGSLRQFLSDVSYAGGLARGDDFRKYIIPKHEVISTELELTRLAEEFADLPEGSPIAADTETGGYDGFDHLRDHVLCAGFASSAGLVRTIPEELVPRCGSLFRNRNRFVWHNYKFDAKFLRAAGVREVRGDEDTMLLSYAIDETKGIHDLEQISSDILGMPDWKFMIQPYLQAAKDAKQVNKYGNVTYEVIPKAVLYEYQSRDISGTLQIFPHMRTAVASDPALEKLYTKTLMKFSDYLIRLEENGLMVDQKQVEKNHERLDAEINRLKDIINHESIVAGHVPINPNSTQQLAVLLYDRLKFKQIPKLGRSTAEDVLDKLPDHPIVKALKAYRKVKKADSTYVVSLPEYVSSDNHVHQSYKIHGTGTGRLACADPNLLNIPRDPLLRGQFKADDGNVFVEVDVNQAELRTLAELSGDVELTRVYSTKGVSIHEVTRQALFGTIKEYTPEKLSFMINKFNCHNYPDQLENEQKMKAKNVNFGIPYGITNIGLAEQCDTTPAEAQLWLDAWAKKYVQADLFIKKCRQSVLLGQTMVTPFGRKKRFGVVSREKLQEMQNQAANFPEQSIASDIVAHVGFIMAGLAPDAQGKQYDRVSTYEAKICNTVYDSILYEMPNNAILVNALIKETLQHLSDVPKMWGLTRIPFEGDAKVGVRWGSLIDPSKYYGWFDT